MQYTIRKNVIIRLIFAVVAAGLAITGATASASGASVVGRDGKAYVGAIEFKAGNQVAMTPPGGATVTLPFAAVAKLWMADTQDIRLPPAATQPSTLPAPWRHADIGGVKSPGDAVEKDGVFALHGAGWGIWGANDSCHFVYQPLSGDGDIIARLVDLPTTDNPFLAGLTIRQGLDADASEVSVMMHPGGVPHLNSRPIHGPGKAVEAAARNACRWIRLIRAGDTFCGLYSADGQNWHPLGTLVTPLNGPVQAGLACAAIANQDLAAATFDHVSLRAEPMGPARGLALVDGSLLTAHIHELNDKTVTYKDSAGVTQTIPSDSVAYLFNQPMPPDMRGKLLGGKAGVSLASGDSIEADIKGINYGQVAIESLLMGAQKVEFAQVVAVTLRPVAAAGAYCVYGKDGSLYRCKSVTVGDGVIVAETITWGTLNVKAADLVGVTTDIPVP